MAIYGFSADYAADVLSDQAHDWNRILRDQPAHIITDRTPQPSGEDVVRLN